LLCSWPVLKGWRRMACLLLGVSGQGRDYRRLQRAAKGVRQAPYNAVPFLDGVAR